MIIHSRYKNKVPNVHFVRIDPRRSEKLCSWSWFDRNVRSQNTYIPDSDNPLIMLICFAHVTRVIKLYESTILYAASLGFEGSS